MKSFQISDAKDFTRCPAFFAAKLTRAYLKHKPDFFVFRDKAASCKDLRRIVALLLAIAPRYKMRLLVNTHYRLAKKPLGVWLNSAQHGKIRTLKQRGFFVAVSTHTPKEAQRVLLRGANLASISPIFYSKGKPPPKTTRVLKEINARMRRKIIALGGINKNNVKELGGIYGYAAISYFR